MDRRDRLRCGGAGGSRLGTVMPLRKAKLTMTGEGERVCRAGPPEEVGQNTKDVRCVSLTRFEGLNSGFAKPGSSSFLVRRPPRLRDFYVLFTGICR
jgi:hypothetical protein